MIRAIVFILLSFNLIIYSQNMVKIPEPVKNTFEEKFPEAEILEAELGENNTCYKITTIKDSKFYVMEIKEDGKMLYVREDFKLDALPEKITKKIKKLFPGAELVQAFKYTGSIAGIEVVIFSGDTEYRLLFNKEGLLKKKTVIEEEVDFGC